MQAIKIRTMGMQDHAELLLLFEKTPGIRVRDADGYEPMSRYLARNPGMSFVAEYQGQIVGCCMAGHDGRRGYLQHLVVSPSVQGQGVARRLVRACIEALAQEGILKTHLFVLTDNQEGRAFWSHLGWEGRSDFGVYSWVEGDHPSV